MGSLHPRDYHVVEASAVADVRVAHLREKAAYLAEIPIVTVSGQMPGLGADSVSCDETTAIEHIVNHLVSIKHRDIGFLGGVIGIESSDIRVDAFRDSLERHGLEYVPEWRVEGQEFGMAGGGVT